MMDSRTTYMGLLRSSQPGGSDYKYMYVVNGRAFKLKAMHFYLSQVFHHDVMVLELGLLVLHRGQDVLCIDS